MFGFKNQKLPNSWKELNSLDLLDNAYQESFESPVVLFKHSVSCGISAYAKERIEDLQVDDSFQFYYLDLLSYREISNEIAKRFGVIHQSPQVIVLKNGEVSFTTSHHGITADAVIKQL